jgi:hypothetical protein
LGVRGRRPTKARESNSKLLAYLMHFPITGHYVPLSPPSPPGVGDPRRRLGRSPCGR